VRRLVLLPALLALLGAAGCGSPEESPFSTPGGAGPPAVSSPSGPEPMPSTTRSQTPPPPPTPTRATHTRAPRPTDPRWRFFTDDRTRWTSPWFAGRHRVMIPFGCTPAPYYDPDPGCADGQGFHHGVDVAMPCGVPLRAGHPALVLDHAALGPAYGTDPVLLRVGEQDVVIGHTTRVYVQPGDRVARGELFARVGDSGAPDGCHLHFEVRPAGGAYTTAVDPLPLLELG
jgi:murein DD-endopeptidase MepM/ murein hydrolase activator NlpD